MRSLTFKWIVTLVLTSLVGVVLVGLFAYRTTVSEYDRLRVQQARVSFISEALTYYRTYRSWSGIGNWLRESASQPAFMRGRPDKFFQEQFALADTSGQIVVGHGPFHVGDTLTRQQLDEGIPIVLDNGDVIGTALLAMPPPALDPREQEYLHGTYQALWIGAIGAGATALLIGILLSRHFLYPLTELTSAITAMRHGDLSQQVEVRTQDELGVLARTFNEMSAEIHHANQLRRQMTADIAHDLRTPLMVIAGYLEALRDGTLAPTPERFEAMNQEALLLRRLVEDLRTLSLADAGELKLVYQAVQPRELLEQVQKSFEPLAHDQEITLKVETDEQLPTVQIDRERMVQVLANLVANALRYTPGGGSVTLRAKKQPGGVQIAVADTGAGIPADQLPNVFERFYRVEASRHENHGESGLGLAIAKSIVEAHRGTIAAASQVGQGTVMTIGLPVG